MSNNRLITSQAVERPFSEPARKKIHAKQTRWKVTIRRRHSTQPPTASSAQPRSRRNRPIASQSPCNPPQMTNVHAAPCQSPPSSIVASRFMYVLGSPLRLPPNGM